MNLIKKRVTSLSDIGNFGEGQIDKKWTFCKIFFDRGKEAFHTLEKLKLQKINERFVSQG